MPSHSSLYPGASTALAFKVFRVGVVRVLRLSPGLVRITFGGMELSGMTSGGLDQRIKLLLPLPGQNEPYLPAGEESYPALRALSEQVRPKMRTYTVREHRPELAEFDVDFVLHGDTGPGSAFAGRARPGDKVGIWAPNADFEHGPRPSGVEYKLDAVRERTLIVGDETALPAVSSILEALPEGVRAKVFMEVSDPAEAQRFTTRAEAEVHWVRRGPAPGPAVGKAVRSAPLPGGDWYAWVAGESGMVKMVRRHLVQDRGLDRQAITFMGYWKHGASEDVHWQRAVAGSVQ